MRRVLVFGGTRYFGKRLIERLIENGDQVTMVTRGNSADDFGDKVRRQRVDRSCHQDMERAFSSGDVWDVVYDNVCYTAKDAQIAIDLFAGKASKWVFTSSMSVYDWKDRLVESDFDPYHYVFDPQGAEVGYGEAKRQAEAVFFQNALFPVSAVRFPIVLGEDDYTRRLHFHVEHVSRKQAIGFLAPDASISFINSAEAAEFLFELGQNLDTVGPINACSNGTISLRNLISLIENSTGEVAMIEKMTADEHASPFGIEADWTLNNEKARALGFQFRTLDDWLPQLIKHISQEE